MPVFHAEKPIVFHELSVRDAVALGGVLRLAARRRCGRGALLLLAHSGIYTAVYAYGELPNEMTLVPAEVIAQEETNALASCT